MIFLLLYSEYLGCATDETFNTIVRPLISYAKIMSKTGIMQYKVLRFNIILTFNIIVILESFFVLLQ